MRLLKLYIIFLAAVLATCSLAAYGQADSIRSQSVISREISDRIFSDTTTYDYVHLDTTVNKNAIKNIILSNLFRQNFDEKDLQPVVKYDKYRGKIIDSIIIIKEQPFNPNNENGKFMRFVYRAGNALHRVTNTSIIENNLLFKTGERVKPQDFTNTEADLRALGIFTNVDIFLVPSATSPDMVNVYVITQDNLSISAGVIYRYSNDAEAYIRDKNFLGTGNELRGTYFANLKDKQYLKGIRIDYNVNNIKGSHVDFAVSGGIGKTMITPYFGDYDGTWDGYDKEHRYRDHTFKLGISLKKAFKYDGDFAFGTTYLNIRDDLRYINIRDRAIEQRQYADLWGGKAFEMGNYNNNLFFTASADYTKYFARPKVEIDLNPYFHNSTNFLASVGFYREKYYSGNLIYGYGYTESIPYGYKLELTGGYRFGEFQKLPYAGLNFDMGNLIRIGYLRGNINVGTFIVPKNQRDNTSIPEIARRATQRTVINSGLTYFTNLLKIYPQYYLRQFITIKYTTGINLLRGEQSLVTLRTPYNLGSVSGTYLATTKLSATAESVVFTPLHVYGFRFAFFGFVDVGTIGDYQNVFKNEFFGVMGLGIRLRNEKLVFNTLQIRVSIGIRSSSKWRNNLYNINSEQKFVADGFLPGKPEYIRYY